MTKAFSGRSADSIDVASIRRGEVTLDDIRIHPDTLLAQADIAAGAGNPQLAENLRRAAELTAVSDERIMAMYEALRPGRSTADELSAIAAELTALGAARNARLFAEAAVAYERRGLTKK